MKGGLFIFVVLALASSTSSLGSLGEEHQPRGLGEWHLVITEIPNNEGDRSIMALNYDAPAIGFANKWGQWYTVSGVGDLMRSIQAFYVRQHPGLGGGHAHAVVYPTRAD